MKELKIKILNEDHSRKVQECLVKLDFTTFRMRDYIQTLFGTGEPPVETTLEELQEMVREKEGRFCMDTVTGIVTGKRLEREFKEGDRVFSTMYGWGVIEQIKGQITVKVKDDCHFYNLNGGLDTVHNKMLFHSPQEAAEYFAAIKEVVSEEERMLLILKQISELSRAGVLNGSYCTDQLAIVAKYFENIIQKG